VILNSRISNPFQSDIVPFTEDSIRSEIEYIEPFTGESMYDPNIDERQFQLKYSSDFVRSVTNGITTLPELMYRKDKGFTMTEVPFDLNYLALHHFVDREYIEVLKEVLNIPNTELISGHLNKLRNCEFSEAYIWLVSAYETYPRHIRHHPINIGLFTRESHGVIHQAKTNPLEVMFLNASLAERRVRESLNLINSSENIGALGQAYSKNNIADIRLLARKLKLK
jgi:hypothetical protein